MARKQVFLVCVVLSLLVLNASADLYLHSMPGSNNRLNEANNNRNNANRLFDSQNNNRGGYNVGENCPSGRTVDLRTGEPTGDVTPECGDQADLSEDSQKGYLKFFEGSRTYLEWTNQHGCGSDKDKVHCELVLQYMCWPGAPDNAVAYAGNTDFLRDGTQTNGNQPDTGIHEPTTYYTKCETRSRNGGLWAADQNVGNNPTAVNTRQNPNGNQSGSECPEERDYYPYWHPSPWKDIAIFTDDVSRCDYYRANSMNSVPKNECACTNDCDAGSEQAQTCWAQNNEADCAAENGCTWASITHANFWDTTFDSMADQPQLECLEAPWNRDNHLGDGTEGRNNHYWWTIPTPQQACGAGNNEHCEACAFRIRYNITTGDLDNLQEWQVADSEVWAELEKPVSYFDIDSRLDGEDAILMDGVRPPNRFRNNPVVDMEVTGGLALAVNTAQFGRTFQDRSHQFQILSRSAEGVEQNACIVNVLRRGRRGNIVQVYPAVEYDFSPTVLRVSRGTWINWQWTGSNTNPNGNDGQGTAGTDRSNIVQLADPVLNTPRVWQEGDNNNMFQSRSDAVRFATVAKCTSADDCDINNELNDASAYFYGGLRQYNEDRTYYYMGTRNNNFSNRSEKSTLIVSGDTGCNPQYPPVQQTA